MRRLLPLLAAGAVAAALLPATASAASVPGAPTGCTATVQDATNVALSWTAPASNGGAALKWYAYQRQGDTGTQHTADASSTSAVWSGSYTTADTFRVRAVNSVGFSTWATCTWGDAPPPPPPSRPYIAYTSGAWLKQTTAGLTVNAAKTSAMRSYIESHDPHNNPNLQGLSGSGGGGWGVTYGMGTCSDPVWKLSGTGPSQWASLKTTGFHAPASIGTDLQTAAKNGGTDLPLVVLDRCDGVSIWAGQVKWSGTGNTLTVGTSFGAFDESSNGEDRRVAGSDSTVNERSRGVIPDSMVIRADQVQYGIDNNTDLGQRLEIFWWETDSSSGMISPPMAGFESGQSGWGAEGQVIGVDKSFVPSAQCSPAAQVIIRTLQNYGAYIGDNAGAGGTSLKLEQDHGQWAGMGLSQRAFDSCGLTWADFVAY